MNNIGAFYRLTLVLLNATIVLFSGIAIPRENTLEISANTQTTAQAKNSDTSSGKGAQSPRYEKKISLESLPRDHSNVDWMRAVREGYINPKGSINTDSKEEVLLNLDVVLRFSDPLIKDVLFSHSIHTYWLNCETCHPKIFAPKVSGNMMTMKEILEGKYCGRCHGVVSFRTTVTSGPDFRDNCLKCHSYRKR